jgi:toxin CptA
MGAALPELKYSEALAIALGPSRIGTGAIAAMAVATLVLIVATPGNMGARILLATWTCCVGLAALRSSSKGLLRLYRSGEIEVGALTGNLRDGSFVAPWLTIIRWRPAGAWLDRTVVVLPDMLPVEAFRELRVLLKWS